MPNISKKKGKLKGVVYDTDSVDRVNEIWCFSGGLKYHMRFDNTTRQLYSLAYQVQPGLSYRILFDAGQKLKYFYETDELDITCHTSFLGEMVHQGADMSFYPNGILKTYTYWVPGSKNKKITVRLYNFPNGKRKEKHLVKANKTVGKQYYRNGWVRSKYIKKGDKKKTFWKKMGQ